MGLFSSLHPHHTVRTPPTAGGIPSHFDDLQGVDLTKKLPSLTLPIFIVGVVVWVHNRTRQNLHADEDSRTVLKGEVLP